MRLHTFHRGTPSWPQVINHLDGRKCPTCKATVHGPEAQEDHHSDHIANAEYRAHVNAALELMHEQITQLAAASGVTLAGSEDGESAGEWEHSLMIEGGQYIPSGEPVE